MAKVNYKTIKKTLIKLRERGLIDYVLDERVTKAILTAQGKKRLRQILPTYLENRPWNRKLYFVFYDFPETTRYIRNIFRDYLVKFGARMLQKSVYLIWYDPTNVFLEFIKKHHLKQLVIISCLGKDCHVSGEETKDLVIWVYKLKELNQKYSEFLTRYLRPNETVSTSRMAFEFLSILKQDPQLPFELLPEDWAGEKAHDLYQRLTKSDSL